MARLQMHRISGVNLYDEVTKEMVYRDKLETAIADAEIEATAWFDPKILRVFELADGRVAIVRETTSGLRQEIAPKNVQRLFSRIKHKADKLTEKHRARLLPGPDEIII